MRQGTRGLARTSTSRRHRLQCLQEPLRLGRTQQQREPLARSNCRREASGSSISLLERDLARAPALAAVSSRRSDLRGCSGGPARRARGPQQHSGPERDLREARDRQVLIQAFPAKSDAGCPNRDGRESLIRRVPERRDQFNRDNQSRPVGELYVQAASGTLKADRGRMRMREPGASSPLPGGWNLRQDVVVCRDAYTLAGAPPAPSRITTTSSGPRSTWTCGGRWSFGTRVTAASGCLVKHIARDLPPARLTAEDKHLPIRLGTGRAGPEDRHLAVAPG